jgi:hypothetical protein
VGRQRNYQVPPRALEIERELVPAVGDKDVASLQSNLFAATTDPSFALKVDAGSIKVIASPRDLRTCVQSTQSEPGDLRDRKISDHPRLDLAAQGLFAGWLDAHRRNVKADEIRPELRTLPR